MSQQSTLDPGSALIIMLIITLLAYGAFPLLFAKLRKKSIKQGKYIILCYCFNFLIFFLFVALNSLSGEPTANGGPYLIWTGIFSAVGTDRLKKKGLLSGGKESNTNDVSESREQEEHVRAYAEPNLVKNADACGSSINVVVRFCRHCGVEIAPDAEFCHRCGTKVVHLEQEIE